MGQKVILSLPEQAGQQFFSEKRVLEITLAVLLVGKIDYFFTVVLLEEHFPIYRPFCQRFAKRIFSLAAGAYFLGKLHVAAGLEDVLADAVGCVMPPGYMAE